MFKGELRDLIYYVVFLWTFCFETGYYIAQGHLGYIVQVLTMTLNS